MPEIDAEAVYQKQNGKWYFHDEIGFEHGPYPTKQKACLACVRHLAEVSLPA